MKDRQTEIREAIQAADETLLHLERASKCLGSASGWGVMDLLGGGFFSTLMKRGQMSDAEKELSQARSAVRRLADELRDVSAVANLHIEMNDFLGIADYFFDGAIADWMVQSRIAAAKNQVDEAIREVARLRGELARL
ncbi:MAG: hypothetical protein PHY12_00485 [Eubacteriales bacterium]|nr:hypothetical protein [Eubacteriales bacterium]